VLELTDRFGRLKKGWPKKLLQSLEERNAAITAAICERVCFVPKVGAEGALRRLRMLPWRLFIGRAWQAPRSASLSLAQVLRGRSRPRRAPRGDARRRLFAL
jgi:hypothetical protein